MCFSRSLSTNSTISAYVFTCCADDFGLMVMSVWILPTWILVVPSAGILMADVLNDVGEPPFAFTVRLIGICQTLVEFHWTSRPIARGQLHR